MEKKKQLQHIIIAIILSIAIIVVPLTVMLVSRNIDSGVEENPPIIENNDEAIPEVNEGESGDKVENVTPEEPSGNISVKLTITCRHLFGDRGKKYIDNVKRVMGDDLFNALNNGDILVDYAVDVQDGTTAMGLTKAVCRKEHIALSESNGYISSIAGLSHKQAGKMSGWTYYVNGQLAMVGASGYVLKDGDAVTWIYVVGDTYA